jgi:hypothetical protein
MRAKTVQFERGGNPLDSLDIGRVRERKIEKIWDEITDEVDKIATSYGENREDQTGKDRITVGFTKDGEFYYVSFDFEDMEEDNPNPYSVGWYKKDPSSLDISGNGDEVYFHSLEEGIAQIKEWLS